MQGQPELKQGGTTKGLIGAFGIFESFKGFCRVALHLTLRGCIKPEKQVVLSSRRICNRSAKICQKSKVPLLPSFLASVPFTLAKSVISGLQQLDHAVRDVLCFKIPPVDDKMRPPCYKRFLNAVLARKCPLSFLVVANIPAVPKKCPYFEGDAGEFMHISYEPRDLFEVPFFHQNASS